MKFDPCSSSLILNATHLTSDVQSLPLKAKVKGYRLHVKFCMLPVEGWSNLDSVVSMQSSAQEATMLFKLIAAAKDSWACYSPITTSLKQDKN